MPPYRRAARARSPRGRAEAGVLLPAREDDVPGLIELARCYWLSAFSQTAPY